MGNGSGAPRAFFRWAEALIIIASCVLLGSFEIEAVPVGTQISEVDVVQYLTHFGYLQPVNPLSQSYVSEEALSRAISEYQAFVGLRVTGRMNAETAYMINWPRVGIKNIARPYRRGR